MWGVAIILLRELTVSGVRLVAAERGVVIAAGWSGKVKTFETMVALVFIFLSGLHFVIGVIGLVLMYVSVILTLYSGIVYIWNSRKIIFESI
jgi:CDP-diacylglycerol--glycerol-3-phosphate 3-phosphatidyltransferase